MQCTLFGALVRRLLSLGGCGGHLERLPGGATLSGCRAAGAAFAFASALGTDFFASVVGVGVGWAGII